MCSYSRLMFPRRQELVTYLNHFANESRLKIVYNSDVSNITRVTDDVTNSDARFTMVDQRRRVYSCR